MRDQSLMWSRPTWKVSPSIISSQELPAGVTPLNWQGGQMINQFAQQASHVSHSAQQGYTKENPMSVTYYRALSNLLSVVISQQYLANKSQVPLNTAGSMIYALKWSEKVTPLGRSYLQQQARARPISDRDYTGWPTSRANDATGSKIPPNRQGGLALKQAAMLTGSTAETTNTGQLNPALSRWLMGFPKEWCEAAIKANQSMLTTHKKRG